MKVLLLISDIFDRFDWLRYIIIGCILLTLFILQTKLYKRNKLRKAKQKQVVRQAREEALEHALLNPLYSAKDEPLNKTRRPFQVEYSKGEKGQPGTNQSEGMFELTEITELSKRKYMFRCQEQVLIGEQFGTIMILPETARPEQVYCQIFFYQSSNYVKAAENHTVYLKRKGKQVIVTYYGIKLKSEDFIILGQKSYQIRLEKQ